MLAIKVMRVGVALPIAGQALHNIYGLITCALLYNISQSVLLSIVRPLQNARLHMM